MRGFLNLDFFLVLAIILIKLTFSNSADPDLFARLAVGKLFTTAGATSIDPFSFSPTKPVWIDHEWLSGVIFYYVYQLIGDIGLILFRTFMAGLTICILYCASIAVSASRLNLFWILLVGLDCNYIWASVVRAQTFTYIFIALFLLSIAKLVYENKRNYLLILTSLFPIWYNSHAGFVVGLGLMSIFVLWSKFFLKEHFKFLLINLCAILLLSFVSPYNIFEFWNYILQAVSMPRPLIPEWRTLDIISTAAILTNIIALIIAYSAFKLPKDKITLLVMSFLVLALWQAYAHERLGAIFLFVSVSLGIKYLNYPLIFLANLLKNRSLNCLYSFRSALIFVIALLLYQLNSVKTNYLQLNYNKYPVGAMDWLTKNYQSGKILVDFNNGSYVLWKGYLKFKVSLDGRYEELYEHSTLDLVSAALNSNAPNHQQSLDKLQPDFILIENDTFNNQYTNYKEIYRDTKFSIFEINNLTT